MTKKHSYLLFLFVFYLPGYSYGQINNLKFESLGTKDGLSVSAVYAITQDQTGFMWFGTRDGLNKYDGYNFTIYKKSLHVKNSISSNDIKGITDIDGTLWMVTGETTLIRFDTKNESFNNDVFMGINGVQCTYLDKNGNFWVGTNSFGLYKYDPTTKKTINYRIDPKNPESIPTNTVSSILEDSDGNIWIGSSNDGICVLDHKTQKFKAYSKTSSSKNALSDDHISFIFEDKKKNIWVGTYGGGLNLFRKATDDFILYQPRQNRLTSSADSRYLWCIEEDNEGNLWVGTENDGLYIFNLDKGYSFTYLRSPSDEHGIGDNTITSIKKDRLGNMWLSTPTAGIYLTNPVESIFTHYRHKEGVNSLSYANVNSFFEDADKNIWIGTDGGGLNKFNVKSGMFELFKHQPDNSQSIAKDHISSVSQDNQKNIWVGSWVNGITLITPDWKFKHFKYDPKKPGSLSSNYILNIFKDSKGRMWIGTYGSGLDLYDEKQNVFKHFPHKSKDPKSISSNYITCIAEDRNGNLWFGTDGIGLSRFDENRQAFVSKPYQNVGISNDRINSIYADSEGYLWVGTNFGLNKFNPSNYQNKVFNTENGLANDQIAAVLGDNNGAIWVSTNKGISKVDANGTIKNYTVDDGLQDNEFKGGKLMSSTGLIYFGGKNGFNTFNPKHIMQNTYTAPIVFTNFQIFNKNVAVASSDNDNSPLKETISQTKKIIIPYYHSSVLSFEFAALNFITKEKKEYMYRLQGFDDKWHNLGVKNSVTFTNLDAGDYVLQVKGTTIEGQWPNYFSKIEITITPPFWKTWWFLIIEALSVAGVIRFIFYYRLASIKKRNKQLEYEVTLRTNEIYEANAFLLESNEENLIQNVNLEELNKENQRKTEKILEQQQQSLIQNQNLETTVIELEGSNKTKDKLFSIIAHDLKNPVMALNGFSQLLTKNLPQLEKEEITEYAKYINSASRSIYKLVTNLLDWSRTHTQNLTYQPQEINVHELVMKNIFLAEIQLKDKNISVDLNIELSHLIDADKHMVDAIVRNLINNAIKFTPKNGNITITSKQIDDQIEIKFEDTGIGMTEDQIYNIRHHRDQSISYGTSGETGTRLGLQIVIEFLEINGGKLNITSEIDKGSVFTVTFPEFQGKSKNQQYNLEDAAFGLDKINYPQDDISLLKGKTILIVDDNEEIRNFLKLLLSGTFEIFEAVNGKEGLKIALETQPNMIITDMMMPVMNGLEFCQQIKGDYNTSHIPIILITSNTGDQDQLASYEAGSDAFLTKPINHKILSQVILNLIKNQDNAKKRFSGTDDLFPNYSDYNKLDEEFIIKVQDYVEQHMNDEDLDYKKICELMRMSRTVLYSKFKALTGMGVHDFIKNIRLAKSVKLLQEGKLNISQIAYEVGFATPSYFTKSFTKKYDLGPKEYIIKLKAKKR